MVIGGRIIGWTGAVRRFIADDVAGFAASFRPVANLPAALHAYRATPGGGQRVIHLRMESDGSGLLLVDVGDAVHLNASAAWLAKQALDFVPLDETVRTLTRRWRGVKRSELPRDAATVYALVDHLRNTTDPCPTCGLAEVKRAEFFSLPARAPYKADLALTYACNNACRHCYNEPQRIGMRPLDTGGWKAAIRRLSEIGVPHLIFTGGEPTLVPALPELIACAAGLGLVTGVNTNGRRLADAAFVRSLAAAGLSHVQITLHSCREEVHDAMTSPGAFRETVAGIRNSLSAGLHTITNTTLTRRNIDQIDALLEYLHDIGLTTLAANGMIYSGGGRDEVDALAESELGPVVVRLRDRAARLGMRFLWYTPTVWCRMSPLELEVGPRRCNAGEYSICIEPNGDVLPCQSYYVAAGNLLRDPWEAIWESPLLRSFRERTRDPAGCGLPPECFRCADLPLCGGGCRIERENHHPCL